MHRWRPFPDHHLTVIDGIVTTRVARTLCDLAGVLHAGRTERALDNCLAMRIVTPAVLHDTFSELASRGRKGTAVMRGLLTDRIDSYVAPASELEARFLHLLRDADLPEPVGQLDVGTTEAWVGRVDFAYPSVKLLVELDSARHHSAKVDVVADERRDAQLCAAGWRVERFTWTELVATRANVVARMRELLVDSPGVRPPGVGSPSELVTVTGA